MVRKFYFFRLSSFVKEFQFSKMNFYLFFGPQRVGFVIPTGYSSQMLWDENMWGKYVGKIQGENMSRKYFGKICGETCRENMWGKIFHRFAGPNIKDDKYIVGHS